MRASVKDLVVRECRVRVSTCRFVLSGESLTPNESPRLRLPLSDQFEVSNYKDMVGGLV